jgi:hypothetical protein
MREEKPFVSSLHPHAGAAMEGKLNVLRTATPKLMPSVGTVGGGEPKQGGHIAVCSSPCHHADGNLQHLVTTSVSPSSWPSLGDACSNRSASGISCVSASAAALSTMVPSVQETADPACTCEFASKGQVPDQLENEVWQSDVNDTNLELDTTKSVLSDGCDEGCCNNDGCNSKDAIVDPSCWATALCSEQKCASAIAVSDNSAFSIYGSSIGDGLGGDLSPSHGGMFTDLSDMLSASECPGTATTDFIPAPTGTIRPRNCGSSLFQTSSVEGSVVPLHPQPSCKGILSSMRNLDIERSSGEARTPALYAPASVNLHAQQPLQTYSAFSADAPQYTATEAHHAAPSVQMQQAAAPLAAPSISQTELLQAISAQLATLQVDKMQTHAGHRRQAPVHSPLYRASAGGAQGLSVHEQFNRNSLLQHNFQRQQNTGQQARGPALLHMLQHQKSAELAQRRDLQLLRQLLPQPLEQQQNRAYLKKNGVWSHNQWVPLMAGERHNKAFWPVPEMQHAYKLYDRAPYFESLPGAGPAVQYQADTRGFGQHGTTVFGERGYGAPRPRHVQHFYQEGNVATPALAAGAGGNTWYPHNAMGRPFLPSTQ